MANLKVNNYHRLKFRFNKDEYWDFFVNKDSYGYYGSNPNELYDKCLISYIDLSDSDCIGEDNWIYGKNDYTWDKSISLEHTLYNITYTGVDNGLFTYRKDRISNKDFVDLFKSNTLKIEADDNRLKLHAVSGNTLLYEYPLHVEDGYVKLNGGFYQGFFKTECDKYQVLPSKFDDGDVYNFEFTLKKCDLEAESTKTLNDKYPENKGIFFYIGTRAENKWVYLYDENDQYGLEECYQLGMDDFVEDGGIDKKTHIIGNFSDVSLNYVGDFLDIDDYTNFNYYDDELYADDYCDWEDMSDYLEIEVRKQPKLIDEDEDHITMGWCCGKVEKDYTLQPYFVGCGCPIKYKKVYKSTTTSETSEIDWNDPFGDGYIGGLDGLEDTVDCQDYVEPELDISDFEYYTDNGFNLKEANWYYFYTDNKFMMFDRTKNGKTIANWVEGTEFMYMGRKNHFKGNLFILMNRTKTGYTIANIDELRDKDINYYNPYYDIYNNALAFRITDNGEIGYRLLTIDCDKEGDDKTKIMEGYSFENVIPDCEWTTVNVRITFLGGDKMKLMFYVNGKLRYITEELPRISPKALNDLYEKQEGVPYNISIGGGTQGLAETIQYNYMLDPTRVYPLEKNFAGTFIGYLKSFKIYNCFMEQMIIENNFKYEKNRIVRITA